MVRIEAFIQPHRLGKVVSALHSLPRFPGFTVFDAHGQGHGRGKGGHYAYGTEQGLLYHKRSVLVILCAEQEADDIANAITQSAHTGTSGDGIVVMSEVSSVSRIRDSGGTP